MCEATKLHGARAVPEGAIAAAQELFVLSWLAGVRVDGFVGLVGAYGDIDFQSEVSRVVGLMGLVQARAAAGKRAGGRKGLAVVDPGSGVRFGGHPQKCCRGVCVGCRLLV